MKSKLTLHMTTALLSLSTLILQSSTALAQGTAFTYQGRLNAGGAPYTGLAEMQFSLWTADAGGSQVGSTLNVSPVGVTNGLFTVSLNFGNQFPGANRWLELAVRTNLLGFTTLSPRQPLSPTPYAITASNLTGAFPANQLSGTVPSANLGGTYSGTVTFNNAANSFSGSGAGLTALNASQLTSGTVPAAALNNAWKAAGNAGTMVGVNFVGTTDDEPLQFRVNNLQALRLDGTGSTSNQNVTIVAGASVNSIENASLGAAILSGGSAATGWIISSDIPGVGGGGFFSTNVYSNSIGIGSHYSLIVGGLWNSISSNSFFSTIAGGLNNRIGDYGQDAVLAGGFENTILGYAQFPTIGGGYFNRIYQTNYAGTIAGGYGNRISPGATYCTIGGGAHNNIGTNANAATIPGGDANQAAGNYSFAAGYRAKANHDGAFLWADLTETDFASTANNQFLIRASGGVGIGLTQPKGELHVGSSSDVPPLSLASRTILVENAAENGRAAFLALAGPGASDSTNRVELQLEANENERRAIIGTTSNHEIQFRQDNVTRVTVWTNGNVGIGTTSPTNKLHVAGGVSATAFVNTSDRNAKENFGPVSPQAVLAKVAALPISTWNFKEMPGATHIGPTAQDFYAAFGLGGSDTTITTIDPDGVALAAIQGLNEKVESGKQKAEIRSQKSETRIQKLEAESTALKQTVNELKAMIQTMNHKLNGGAK